MITAEYRAKRQALVESAGCLVPERVRGGLLTKYLLVRLGVRGTRPRVVDPPCRLVRFRSQIKGFLPGYQGTRAYQLFGLWLRL